MKTATIKKIESVNGGQIWTVTIQWPEEKGEWGQSFDESQIGAGSSFSSGEEGSHGQWLNFWEKPTLKVGDQITEEGGEPIIAEVGGKVTHTTIITAKENDYRDVWCEKHGLKR